MMSQMRRPSAAMRAIALCCAVALVQLEIGAMLHGDAPVQAAYAQSVGTNTMAVLVVPPNRRKQDDAYELERLCAALGSGGRVRAVADRWR